MTAGKGLLHLEEAPEGGFAHLLQLWVNLPAKDKMTEPRYQDILFTDTPVRKEARCRIQGDFRVIRKCNFQYKKFAAITMVEISIRAGRTGTQNFSQDYNDFIYVLQGNGLFGANKVQAGKDEVLWMEPSPEQPSEITMQATEDLKVLVFAGKPLREPVVARGPFVMNTEEQIRQAYRDMKEGKFGDWKD